MSQVKRFIKRNSHNVIFKNLAGFGRSLNRFYENKNYDIRSNGELTILKKIAQCNPSIIIDGGANVGKYSKVIYELIPNAKVYAFEPVQSTFNELKEAVAQHSNIIPLHKGLFKENCSKEIHLFPSSTHSSLYDIKGWKHKAEHTETIELLSGDSFMKAHNIDKIDLLKIDIEGAEYNAILGFNEHLEQGKIKAIQFEYGYINITTKQLLIDYYEYFESKGYIVGKIFPKTVEFRKYNYKHEDFLGPNFIAVRKSDTALIKLLENK